MWAHSANSSGCRQRLDDHLRGVAALARRFAEPFGYGDLAWWAGMIHDGGKAWHEWQARLLLVEGTKRRVGGQHMSYGAWLARERRLTPVEWVVAGHHGGLSCPSMVEDLYGEDEAAEEALRDGPWADAERALRSLVPEIYSRIPALPFDFTSASDPLVRDFAIRFLYSCLVDADALDTQAHRLGWAEPRVGADLDAVPLLERFLSRRAEYLARRRAERGGASSMDGLRESVFDAAMKAAVVDHRLWKITAPTGAAKTIAVAGFGLRHAAEFGKRRIIVAVPFITITEQNAAVYRALLNDTGDGGDPVVLEHHSSVDLDPAEADPHSWHRLAAENWDAPFVVTTTVQLFESLFGRKPSRLRKVHRLANSVIVLDEVQALPHRLLPQVADALRILTERFNVTVLLSSATQPELGALTPLHEMGPREIVPDVSGSFGAARRVRYQWLVEPRPTLERVVAEALSHPQAMIVVNTVRDARTVFELVRASAVSSGHARRVAHLSTGMCSAHRRLVLGKVRGWVRDEVPLCLVSTSLIEAGVDLDLPVVFRAVAPPDSVAQAAGRCNREGRLGELGGLIVIFDPVDGGIPPSYKTQISKAKSYFGEGKADPDDVTALRSYFEDLYRTLGIENPGGVSKTIEQHRRYGDFIGVTDGPKIGQGDRRDRELAFRMIHEDTVPVVTPYGNSSERRWVAEALAALRSGTADRDVWRGLQPYLTTIRRRTANSPEVIALTKPVVGELLEWRGEYDDGYGLVLQPKGEDYIW